MLAAKIALLVSAAAIMSLGVNPVSAQNNGENSNSEGGESSEGGIGDIVVTARQKAETLVNVPVAVTALSADDVNRYASANITEIARLAPQVMVTEGYSGSGATFSIRGLGSSSNDAGIEQAVAVVIDGVQISRGRIVTAGTFDISQVTVLKGPQALFFGKNSPAGVIAFSTMGPTRERSGYLKAGYEFNADEATLEGAVGGPISDTLGVRVAFKAGTSKGWLTNTNKAVANPFTGQSAYPFPGSSAQRIPGGDNFAGRLSLKWEPSSDVTVGLKVSGGYMKLNSFAGTLQQFCKPGIVPVVAGVPNPGNDCTYDNRINSNYMPTAWVTNWPVVNTNGGKNFYRQKWALASLSVDYAINSQLSLTSTTGFAHLDTTGFGDSQGGDIGYIFNANPEVSDNFTQELRLASKYDSPVNFMLGAYYEHAKRNSQSFTRTVNLSSPDPVTGKWYTYDRVGRVKGDTLSAFGSMTWNILENLELSGGVRYTHEKKSQSIELAYLDSRLIQPVFLADGVTPNPAYPTALRSPGNVLVTSDAINNWSPEATLNWHPVTNTTIYVAYKSGFKSGGFSNPGQLRNNYTAANIAFGPETARGFEFGVKGQFLNNTLRAEFAAYTYDFDGLQLSSYDGATITYQVRNAAKARTRGAELQLQWQPVRAFNLRSALAYNDGRYVDFKTAQCYTGQTAAQGCTVPAGQTLAVQDLSGQPIVRAPKWNFMAGATYDLPLGEGLALELSGDGTYSSSYFTSDTNEPFTKQPSFWLWNASVRLHSEDRWSLALIGKNLADKYYLTVVTDNVVTQPGQYFSPTNRGRQVLLQAQLNF